MVAEPGPARVGLPDGAARIVAADSETVVFAAVGEHLRDRLRLLSVNHRHACDCIPRGEILLHEHRRKIEGLADVGKAVEGIVRRKVVGGSDRVNPKHLPDGAIIFVAVEPPQRSRPLGRRKGFVSLQLRTDPLLGGGVFLFRGPRVVVLGRHVAARQPLHDTMPRAGTMVHGGAGEQVGHVEASLGVIPLVAFQTVLSGEARDLLHSRKACGGIVGTRAMAESHRDGDPAR